ncbi:MAG: EAL domain-containing protein [Proteobacteria bacterium]|nr:EAL domain-containing protein [Pseudomonadota bacterium]
MSADDQPNLTGLLLQRRATVAVAVLAAVLGLLLALFDATSGVETSLQLARSSLLARPATGKVALVEMDARSFKAFNRWPWPRSLHGRAIDRLQAAGARQIAFDVDFSARSAPAEDAALAAAIARSRSPVVLPTFRQAAAQGSSQFTENLPVPELRSSALLGSVNIAPDAYGFVRANPYGVVTDGVPRPSIAAMLADETGRVGQAFPIDLAIDLNSIPRFSYVDLIEGRIPASAIRGRNFLIGATAVEMGDRYAVPGKGVIPGALVQLLAAETLLQHSAPVDRGFVWPLLAVLLGLLFLRPRMGERGDLPFHVGAAVAVLMAPLVLEAARLGTVSVVPALASLALSGAAYSVIGMFRAVYRGRMLDPETMMPNARALSQARAMPGTRLVVLRVVNFPDVVNVLGQRRAASLLRRLAERLTVMAPGQLHRVAPGELGWIAAPCDEESQALQLEGGATLFNQPVEIDGRALRLVPAFGIASINGDVAIALNQAQAAADRAATAGQRWECHSDETARASDWKLTLASELDTAMSRGDIWVAYQPKVDVKTGKYCSAEALVRWNHPQRGAIPPESLVELVEESGRIAEFTMHVLNRALADREMWARAGADIAVAVNVSALLPADPTFVDKVRAVVQRYPGSAGRLTLEVTESATMRAAETVRLALEALVAIGITVSIDDYGTGQSTLTYLKQLPAREIKIDKSFVLNLASSRSDQLMVRSTIELAHELGYKVVAEGVESEAILEILREAQCDVVQGWLYGKPMRAAELLNLLLSRRARAA